ncbi:hypothetical protein [Archangium minus]
MSMLPPPAHNKSETPWAGLCRRSCVLHRAAAWLLARTAAPLV